MANRKMRVFKRWMKSQLIDCSDALDLVLTDEAVESCNPSFSVYVKALLDLHVGDVVAKIPKRSCLTVKTSGACHMIEEAGLDGALGLAVALMYEISLGPLSRWFGYLQMLPRSEPIPLLWSIEEIDSLLAGTELQKIIKEDKDHIYEDWKECIQPLLATSSLELNPKFFGVENYFAARSLIASRSFEIDAYHGSGMVPLADLFNHKTDGEDVHFTSTPSLFESDSDNDDDKLSNEDEDEDDKDAEPITQKSDSEEWPKSENDVSNRLCSADDPTVLEMIMVKDVKAGVEVFNTYGSSGNAALLHRYGFTEPGNPYDIVNIDMDLVTQWSSSMFTHRHSRTRLSLWRKLDYSGCVSQNSEYFEVSFNGEPQVELLVLLYVMLLKDEEYCELDLAVSTSHIDKSICLIPLGKGKFASDNSSTLSKNLLLNTGVRKALLYLADMRDSLYNSSLQDDIEALNKCSHVRDRKLYHSLMLRISERRILEKLRSYASGAGILNAFKRATARKRRRGTMHHKYHSL